MVILKGELMKNLSISFIITLTLTTCSFAQPDTLWTNTFGGSGNERGYSVQQTGDGGYIIAGYTESNGPATGDFYLIRTDASGIEQWTQTFGGNGDERGFSVQQTSDGGYVIAGYTYSYGAGSADIYLIKTDSSGTEEWSKTFGGSSYDYAFSIQQTSDGGYIITGYTKLPSSSNFDIYLIKTDASGTEQWSQTFGGTGNDYAYSVQQTGDGGYIIAGSSYPIGTNSSDIYLIKTDASGTEQWSQTFGGTGYNFAYSVQQTSDDGYIIAGSTNAYGAGLNDVLLIKTDVSGIEQWSQTFGGIGNDYACSMQQTSDGGYIIAGYTIGVGYMDLPDVLLIKTDASGTEQWNQTFGGSDLDDGRSVQQTSDGGYIITGSTISYGAGGYDVWLLRLGPDLSGIVNSDPPQLVNYSLLPASPNPCSSQTLIHFKMFITGNVQIHVYDQQGRIVATLADGWQTAGMHQVPFNTAGLPSGIYLTRFTSGDFTQTQKLVVVK